MVSGHDKWKHIMLSNDSKKLWRAINWKGEIGSDQSEKPDDKRFKCYFEDLLNPDKIVCADMPTVTNVIRVRLMDDAITPVEVKDVLENKLKLKKGGGADGFLPKQLKCLLIQMDTVFDTDIYHCYVQFILRIGVSPG